MNQLNAWSDPHQNRTMLYSCFLYRNINCALNYSYIMSVILLNREIRKQCRTIVSLKSTILWDITPYSPLNVNRHFGGTYRLHLQDWKISRSRNHRESRWQEKLCWAYSSTLKLKAVCSPETSADFNRLHSIIAQKILLFITTAVRTSVRFPAVQDFLFSTASRPALGPTQPPIRWVPAVKRPGHETNHSPPSSAEVKNGGAIPPFPHVSSWHSA
jgi:hypothetical protein